MAGQDTRNAEKSYLTRSGASPWESAKPFSQPGSDTLDESARLLHDFAVAMMALRPAPDDLILDLGSGGCWCSDLLVRLNRRVVATDLSLEMLRIGKSRRTAREIPAVAADLEGLPFRDASFDKAVCLNALHHVPDMPRALREISRVLKEDGVVVFSEPGVGHANAGVSVAAMRDFGVLEQDVPFGWLARQCREAGFQDIRLKAMSYALPALDLTPEQWDRWSRRASRRRPLTAVAAIWRAALSIVGFGKDSVLFEETFERSMMRALHGAMNDHPFVIASKSPRTASQVPEWSADISIEQITEAVSRGDAIRGRISMTNTGSRAWHKASRSGIGYVTLGVQLLDENGHLIDRDFHREFLSADVMPRETITVTFHRSAPDHAGSYRLKFDLVSEGVTWFESTGSGTSVRSIRVR